MGLPGDAPAADETLTVAQFNVQQLRTEQVQHRGDGQAAAAAAVVQHVDPDVLLVNELSNNFQQGWTERHNAVAFGEYLREPQRPGLDGVDFAEWVAPECNTGIHSGADLAKDGLTLDPGSRAYGDDCFGFGEYPGRYAMALFSDLPVEHDAIRTFRRFRWANMPADLMPTDDSYDVYYTPAERERMRLSSKTHAVVPLRAPGDRLNILIGHPTPPVHDGPENRNGRRCHDEIRLLGDLARGEPYVRDDDGQAGGLAPDARFVIAGDLNAEPGETYRPPDGGEPAGRKADFHHDAPTRHLIENPRVNTDRVPASAGGRAKGNAAGTQVGEDWTRRADYLLPSADVDVVDCGVVWPGPEDDPALREDVRRASNHRLVWARLAL